MALCYCWYCTCSLGAGGRRQPRGRPLLSTFERFGRCRFQAFVFVLASKGISLLLRARRAVVTRISFGTQVWSTLYQNIALAILQVLLGKCVLLGNESLCLIQGLFPTLIEEPARFRDTRPVGSYLASRLGHRRSVTPPASLFPRIGVVSRFIPR